MIKAEFHSVMLRITYIETNMHTRVKLPSQHKLVTAQTGTRCETHRRKISLLSQMSEEKKIK